MIPQTENTRQNGLTILLVEDDPADQQLARRAFEDSKLQSRLQIVDDGLQALDYLRRKGHFLDEETSPRPDLVLLDLNLPGLDGRGVLASIRADPELRHIPVVVLTTSRDQQDVRRTYDLGVNSYISKPFDMDRFVDLLRALESYWFDTVTLPPQNA